MIILVFNLHFTPGQHNEDHSQILHPTDFEVCSQRWEAEGKFVCLYTEAKKGFPFPPSQEEIEKLHSLGTWSPVETWSFILYVFLHSFLSFSSFVSLGLILKMFYSDLSSLLILFLIFPWVLNFDHDNFHFCSQFPDKILILSHLDWAQ